MEIVYKILIELGILVFLGLLYYLFQKRKIIHYIASERSFALEHLYELAHEYIHSDHINNNQLNIVKELIKEIDEIERTKNQYLPYHLYKDIIYAFDDSDELKLNVLEFKEAIFNEKEN